jgi:putative hydrolase of the HAD superfamily
MMARHFKLLTFDLDDTLWHIAPVIERANLKTFQWLEKHCPELTARYTMHEIAAFREEIVRTRPELQHQISQQRIEAIAAALQRVGYSDTQALEHSLAAFDVFIKARNEVEFFEFALESLALLKYKYTLGVLTNGNACIKRLDLQDYFSFSISAEQINASKPAADHFHAAIAKSHIPPTQIIHIGDHQEHDIHAAQQLGITTIWVNHQGVDWQEGRRADAEISSLRELVAAIEYLEACCASA